MATRASCEPIAVACVLAKLELGGAQLSVAELQAALVARGVRCRLLVGSATASGLSWFRSAGLAVDVYGRGGDLQWSCDAGFARWLAPRLRGADIVHAHMFGGWWAAARAAGDGVPLVATEHNSYAWPERPLLAELRAALGRVDLFFAPACARGPLLRNGLPAARLRPALVPIGQRARPPRPAAAEPRVVFAGRFHREKGPDVLLEALARMPAPPPTLMLGAGPQEAELRSAAHRCGLERIVRFAGWRSEPGLYLAGAAAVVVPSRREAFSRTAVLAMALGAPVIGTAAEDLPATLGERRGVVVPPDDPASLAAAIEDVLDGRAETDREGAREFARLHGPGRIAAAHERAYRALVATRRIRPRQLVS